MSTVTMKQLLEAGVHFGHQTKRWNPKMKEYIFGSRNGIYIIDLKKTLRLMRGSLVERLRRCGRPNCACARDPAARHGAQGRHPHPLLTGADLPDDSVFLRRLVVQQVVDLVGDGLAVAERHDPAAAVGEHLAGVPVGRGDDGLAGAQRIGQCAGGDLLLQPPLYHLPHFKGALADAEPARDDGRGPYRAGPSGEFAVAGNGCGRKPGDFGKC
jgi:hypothetical protein